jgi:hypothetical protein
MNGQQISAALDALEAISPMSNWINQWDRESTHAVEDALGCSRKDARHLWRAWRDQNLVELISDHNGEPGLKTNSQWSWQRISQVV